MRTVTLSSLCSTASGALWACVLSSSLAACKPKAVFSEQREPEPDEPGYSALNLSGVDARDRSLVTDEQTTRISIAKRILGLNPDLNDRHDHVGLMNVADLMGLEFAFNDCDQPWVVNSQGDDIKITSQHQRGPGPNCRQRDAVNAVEYHFKDWALAPEAVEPRRWDKLPEAAGWPKPTAVSQAHNVGSAAAYLDDAGILEIKTKETSQASVTAHEGIFSHHVKYERTVRGEPEFQPLWRGANFGLQIVPGVGGGAGFSIGNPQKTVTQLTRVSCAADVLQPPGCQYRVTLVVDHLLRQQKYRAMVNLVPQVIAISGRLMNNSDCKFRPLRRADGSCDIPEGDRFVQVSDSFGKAGDLHFGEALTQMVSENKGNWLWSQMRNGPLPSKDGIPALDWALRYFADEDFGNLSYEFVATTESVDRCTLRVEVLSPNEPNCQSLQDGASIEPVKTPII